MPKQMAEISRRIHQTGNGYDFYKSLTLAIRAYIENKTRDEIDLILNSPVNPAESNLNRLAFESFERKFGKKKSKMSLFEKRQRLFLADRRISVTVSPTFTIETASGFEVYHVWATQNPQVNKHMGGMACYICKEAFRKSSSSNYDFKFFDSVGEKVFSTFYNNTSALVERTAQDIAHWADR
jgi:hypothetical protein